MTSPPRASRVSAATQRRWFIIECSRGREAKCVDLLERWGYDRAWYPYKKKEARSRGRTIRHYTVAIVPGYLFIPAERLDVYQIHERMSEPQVGLWLRVLSPGGEPYSVTDNDMAQMQSVPERVKQIVDEATRKEIEEREAKRPALGQRAKVISGPLEGRDGIVTAIVDGEVKMTIDGWLPVTVAQDIVVRI